ncbi:MAG: MBL fold metallo-hydrolase [Bacteroidia bacterium]
MSQSHKQQSPFTVTFLGTGTSHGIPVITCDCLVCKSSNPKDKRFRSSILIESESTSIAIDVGPDFRMQMLRSNVKHLDAILITHEHRDHIAGLDDIRIFNYKKKGPFDLYCVKRVEDDIRHSWPYIFTPNPYPGIPSIEFKRINQAPFTIGDLNFEPLDVLHYKLPVKGFRIGDFAYITDVSHIPEETFEKLNGLDAVVLGALRRKPHISHFSLEEAKEAAQRIGAKSTYFIHMSHDMGFHNEVEDELPSDMHLSYDGLKIKFGA